MYFCADTDSDFYSSNSDANNTTDSIACTHQATDIVADGATDSYTTADLFTDRSTNRCVVLCIANQCDCVE
jgi:hypothetical protein